MAYLAAGYTVFFLLAAAYLARLALMGRRLAAERRRLAAAEREAGGTNGSTR